MRSCSVVILSRSLRKLKGSIRCSHGDIVEREKQKEREREREHNLLLLHAAPGSAGIRRAALTLTYKSNYLLDTSVKMEISEFSHTC